MKYKLILCPANSPHWAKLVDENNKYIQFMSDPTKGYKNYEDECEQKLKKALEIDAQHKMVRSLIDFFNNKKFLSPKQMNWLNSFIGV